MWAPRGRLQGELAAHQQPHEAQERALSGTTALVEASHGAKEPYLRSQLPIARAGALRTTGTTLETILEAEEEALEAAEEAVEEVEEAAEEEAAEEDLSSEA